MLKCNFVFCGMYLSTFSHDAVPILASPESIAGGTILKQPFPEETTFELIQLAKAIELLRKSLTVPINLFYT